MFGNSNNQQLNTSLSPATAGGINKKRLDRQLPSGQIDVPGFPDYEAVWWKAPEGSGNAGAIFAGVYRVGQDRRGRQKKFRTFPIAGGGLIANIVGSTELLAHFADEKTISEAERGLYFKIAVGCAEAVYSQLNPRGNARQFASAWESASNRTTGNELGKRF